MNDIGGDKGKSDFGMEGTVIGTLESGDIRVVGGSVTVVEGTGEISKTGGR